MLIFTLADQVVSEIKVEVSLFLESPKLLQSSHIRLHTGILFVHPLVI